MKRQTFGRYIVADPAICHGEATFKGTRILVADVLELVARGMAWEEIITQCHDSLSRGAISEAVRLAGKSFVRHVGKSLQPRVSA